jgi:TonB family protein
MTEPDKLNRWLVGSTVLHVGLVAVILLVPSLLPFQASESWGGANAGLEGIDVKLVGASGIALPSPEITNPDAAANESKGFYKEEPPPPEPPAVEEKAEAIPEKNAPKKAEAKKEVAKAPPKTKTPEPEVPSNAVPFGSGGNPSIGYGQAAQTGPAGAAGFGDGAFGAKYAGYVTVMNRKISQNWLRGLVDSARISGTPRVYFSFDILRDGSIANIELKQSSGVPSLDNSARRALLASTPLQPLPSDYSGAKVTVSYYFEYVK